MDSNSTGSGLPQLMISGVAFGSLFLLAACVFIPWCIKKVKNGTIMNYEKVHVHFFQCMQWVTLHNIYAFISESCGLFIVAKHLSGSSRLVVLPCFRNAIKVVACAQIFLLFRNATKRSCLQKVCTLTLSLLFPVS